MIKRTIAIAALCCATVGCEFPTESKKPGLFEGCPDIIFSCSGPSLSHNSVQLTPEEQTQAILDAILADEDLDGNAAGSLVSKLENVIAKLDKDNVGAAINQLQAFINQIQALIQSGQLAQQDGDLLIDAAQSVIDQLSA